MKKRIALFVAVGIITMFGAWYFIAPLYKNTPPQTTIATVLKPSTPLEVNFLRGQWTLVFFGYMSCPNVCPRTLGLVRDAWNQYPTHEAPAKFVFANITPCDNNDLQNFVHNYHADFRGISNDDPDMQYLYEKLNIYAQEQGSEISHTAALMLIDPQGRLYAIFSPPFTAEELVKDLNALTEAG